MPLGVAHESMPKLVNQFDVVRMRNALLKFVHTGFLASFGKKCVSHRNDDCLPLSILGLPSKLNFDF